MTTIWSKKLMAELKPLIDRNIAEGWQRGPVRMPDGSQPPVPIAGTVPDPPVDDAK